MPDDTCKLIGIVVSSPKLKGPNAEPAAAPVQTTMEAAPAVVAAPEPAAGAVEAGSGGGAVAGSFCVRESIRVRVIDKRYAGGMLYNKKGVVVDVSSAAASQLLVCGARLARTPCASPSCYHCALNCAQTQCDQAPRWHAAAAQMRRRGGRDDATNLL